MTIREMLEAGHSKKQTMKIVRYVGFDQHRFNELISFCFAKDEQLAQRASWPAGYCIQKHPGLVYNHLKNILKEIKKGRHNAIRRNFLKSLETVYVHEKFKGELISICFDLLNNPDEPVAVKVYSMMLLDKMCYKYPDLSSELSASIESQEVFATAGFISRGDKILRKIERRKLIHGVAEKNYRFESV